MTLSMRAPSLDLHRQPAALASWRAHAGSVVGSEHRRTGRGNQDAWHLQRSERAVIGVVADGCGGAPHSEVGAWIGARIWANALAGLLDEGLAPTDPALWSSACARCLERLGALVRSLPGSPIDLVHEALLFTVVGFVLTPAQLVVHAIGDGLVWLDGQLSELGPFPENRPPYLAYGLHGPTPKVEIIHAIDPDRVGHLIVATDGAAELLDQPGGLEPFTDLARPHAIDRRLAQLNRERLEIDWSAEYVARSHGQLSDDTTLLVLGRAPGSPA
jgi:hypothetical protein